MNAHEPLAGLQVDVQQQPRVCSVKMIMKDQYPILLVESNGFVSSERHWMKLV